jgi:prolyl oligopeptidase
MTKIQAVLIAAFIAVTPTSGALAQQDPYLWLEEVEGAQAVAWAKAQNEHSTSRLATVPEYEPILKEITQILDSQDKIPGISFMGPYVYNFWQDAVHVRGIWRRTSIESYSTETPAWELVLDLDALSERESTNWVWKRASCLWPNHRHCMLSLSRGGADASVWREFDTFAKGFVPSGFDLPEAKSTVSWRDKDTLWVATDFGEGSLTASGYPRVARLWSRGTPLAEATTVFEGRTDDVAVSAYSAYTPEGRYDLVSQIPAFFRENTYLRLGGRYVKLDLPSDASFRGIFANRLLVSLRTPWETDGATRPADALLAIDLDAFLLGDRAFDTLFEPGERIALDSVAATRDAVVISVLDNVRSRVYRLRPEDGGWARTEIELPGLGTVSIGSASDFDERFLLYYTDLLTPSGLYSVAGDAKLNNLKTSPVWFDSEGMTTTQHEAVSKDGTHIPYFIVFPQDFDADGTTPTLLYGYGGFEISMQPTYSGVTGRAWLERGGAGCSRTYAAEASSARPGTRPRSKRTGNAHTTTSSRSLRISSHETSHHRETWALWAAPTADYSWGRLSHNVPICSGRSYARSLCST